MAQNSLNPGFGYARVVLKGTMIINFLVSVIKYNDNSLADVYFGSPFKGTVCHGQKYMELGSAPSVVAKAYGQIKKQKYWSEANIIFKDVPNYLLLL